jgi:hypothetical protein
MILIVIKGRSDEMKTEPRCDNTLSFDYFFVKFNYYHINNDNYNYVYVNDINDNDGIIYYQRNVG